MAKFVAFMIWVSGPGRLATLCQIAFNQTRSWMNATVLQYAKNPVDDCIVLPGLPEAGLCLIERHIKSKGYSIANSKLPSSGPQSKKQKINLNTAPNNAQYGNNFTKQGGNFSNYGRGGRKSGGRYGGRNQGDRGAFSGRGRGGSNTYVRNDRHSENNPQHVNRVPAPGQKICGMFGQTSTSQEPVYVTTLAQ